MVKEDFTSPPCIACSLHNGLESEFTNMKSRNYTEHMEIKTSLVWMVRIGSSLVAGIGIIFFMVWSLQTEKGDTEKAVVEIRSDIKYLGEKIDQNLDHQKEVKLEIYKEIDECKDDFYLKK